MFVCVCVCVCVSVCVRAYVRVYMYVCVVCVFIHLCFNYVFSYWSWHIQYLSLNNLCVFGHPTMYAMLSQLILNSQWCAFCVS